MLKRCCFLIVIAIASSTSFASGYIQRVARVNIVDYSIDSLGILNPNNQHDWDTVLQHFYEHADPNLCSTGVIIEFPGGFYDIANTINIPSNNKFKSISIIGVSNGRGPDTDTPGENHYGTIFLSEFDSGSVIKLIGESGNKCNIRVQGITFEGDGPEGNLTGIYLGGSINNANFGTQILDCQFKKLRIAIKSTRYCDNIAINRIQVSNCGQAIFLQQGDYLNLEDITIDVPYESKEEIPGIEILNSAGSFLKNILVNSIDADQKAFSFRCCNGISLSGHHGEGNKGIIFDIVNSEGIHISSSTEQNQYKTLLNIDHSRAITISHHTTYKDSGQNAFNPNNQADVRFYGTSTDNSNTYGISLSQCVFKDTNRCSENNKRNIVISHDDGASEDIPISLIIDGLINIQNTSSMMRFTETDAGLNMKNWGITSYGGTLEIETWLDNWTGGDCALQIKKQTNSRKVDFIEFATNGDGNEETKMRFTKEGELGIGKTNPSAKLDVNGDINASEIKINGHKVIGEQQGAVSVDSIVSKSDQPDNWYNNNERLMLNHLKADVIALRGALNDLVTKLSSSGHGLLQ